MVELSVIESVIEEQREEILVKKEDRVCSRNEESLINLESKLAQVAIGVRRSGKSTLCFNVLNKAGVNYAYVNFDDDRFSQVNISDLDNVLLILHKLYGDFRYLFMDEVQDVEGWHLFVNRLLRRGIHIVITGSNAKLLSSELATHMTGRSSEIPLYPFGFKEYCEYFHVDTTSMTTANKAARLALFDEYLRIGGFPELLEDKNNPTYIKNLVGGIISNDIVTRHKIKYKATFEDLINHILNTIPCEINYSDLQTLFRLNSHHTAENYVSYAEKAYLISICRKWSTKSSQRVLSQKAYPIDVAFMNRRNDAFVGDNLGFRLESIVYIELLRRHKHLGRNIFFYQERAGESDFLVCDGSTVIEAIQVSYDISLEKTRKREIKGLLLASKATHCRKLTLVTRHHRETVEQDGVTIDIIPAYDWLVMD